MLSRFWIVFSCLFLIIPLHAVPSGFVSPYHSGGGLVTPRLSIQKDQVLKGSFSLIYGLGFGKSSQINQFLYLGDIWFIDLRAAGRYYLRSASQEGFFTGLFLMAGAADIPYSLGSFQQYYLNAFVGYGLELGWKYIPLRLNISRGRGSIGIEPRLQLGQTWYMDMDGGLESAWWYTIGLDLVLDISVRPNPRPAIKPQFELPTNSFSTNQSESALTNT